MVVLYLETSCSLEIGDISRKLRWRCGCQFPVCALGLNHLWISPLGAFIHCCGTLMYAITLCFLELQMESKPMLPSEELAPF
jgi:hypothetical protein